MNKSYNPCDNFYAFTCGGYYKSHENSKTDSESPLITWAFSEIEETVYDELKELLREDNQESDPRIFSLVKKYYTSCIDSGKRLFNIYNRLKPYVGNERIFSEYFDMRGEHPLENVIQQLGGWPVVEGDDWNGTKFNWIDMDIKLRTLGYPPMNIFNIFVEHDPFNLSKSVLKVRLFY